MPGGRALTWRERAQAVIYPAMREGKALGLKGRALRRFINKQYPFSVRKHFPYRVWLDELARAMSGELPGQRQILLDLS